MIFFVMMLLHNVMSAGECSDSLSLNPTILNEIRSGSFDHHAAHIVPSPALLGKKPSFKEVMQHRKNSGLTNSFEAFDPSI